MLVASLFIACNNDTSETPSVDMDYPRIQVAYPETVTGDVADDYFGTQVADPYRWLEDDNAEDTKAWVEEQNKATFGYLDQIPFRSAVRDRYEELFNYEKYSAPSRVGDYYFFSKNDGLQNQAVIYRQKGLEGEPEVFIDPNKESIDACDASDVAMVTTGIRHFKH